MEASDAKKYRDKVMKRISRFIEYVKGSDIILLHENEKDIYGDTPERCLDLITSLSSPNLKLIFDPANYIQCHVETYPYAFHLLKDEVIYYHIKDAMAKTGKVVPSGYGDGQIKAIIKELYERNYKGFLSIEPHLGDFEGFERLEGDKGIPKSKGKSDASKFQLAATSLMEIIKKVQNE
jgi:sugar phosphate isomerase/epimerase